MELRKNTGVNLCRKEAGMNLVNKLVTDKRYRFINQTDQMDRDIPFHICITYVGKKIIPQVIVLWRQQDQDQGTGPLMDSITLRDL